MLVILANISVHVPVCVCVRKWAEVHGKSRCASPWKHLGRQPLGLVATWLCGYLAILEARVETSTEGICCVIIVR